MAERPSQTDPSFNQFLQDLKKQNNQAFVLQALELKYAREVAGEDDDKREEQLNELIDSSKNIEKAITGFKVDINVEPIVDSLGNVTQVLQKQLEELTLSRKISEGSLEYDKESSQYRNTSGREITSLVSGKDIRKGGYVDFETAADRLTGQGKRVRESEANQLKLAPISTAGTGKAITALTGAPKEKEEKKISGIELKPDDRTWKEFGKDLLSLLGFKGGGEEVYNSTKGRYAGEFVKAGKGTEREGMLDYERRIKEEKDNERLFDLGDSKLKPTPAVANPEADNIETPAEIQNKLAKEDIELTKENKTIFQQQLLELQSIRDALSGTQPQGKKSTPGVVPSNPEEGKSAAETTAPGVDIDIDRRPKRGASLGSKALKFLSGKGGAVLGGALAVGAGVYTAYQGYSAAEDSKQAKMEDIQAKLDSGEIDEKQASALRKEAGNTATVEKSSAVGEGTGMAAGGIAGMKAGALIGTALGGPVGTVVGGALGGAAGMFAGSKAGKWIGEKAGQGINAVKGFFGGGEDPGAKAKAAVTGTSTMVAGEPFVPGQPLSTKQMSVIETAKASGTNYPPEVESQYAKQKTSNVQTGYTQYRGLSVAQTSSENQAMRDQASTAGSPSTTILNNISGGGPSSNFVPMKLAPRVDSTLTRYQDRIAAY